MSITAVLAPPPAAPAPFPTPLDKIVHVRVDRGTWPATTPFPTTFARYNRPRFVPDRIPMLHALHLLGLVTTVPLHGMMNASGLWPVLRYVPALAAHPGLRVITLASPTQDVKNALSEEMGVATALAWLWKKLPFAFIFDGRQFANLLGGGTGKAPDFVLMSMTSWPPQFHILECKGTQSGPSARSRQFGKVGGKTGAWAQKHAFTIPAPYAGQRLATGLDLDTTRRNRRSTLKIIDPESSLRIDEDNVDQAVDFAIRSTVARALALVGLPTAATEFLDPTGAIRRKLKIPDPFSDGGVQARRRSVREEISRISDGGDMTLAEEYAEVSLSGPDSIPVRSTALHARMITGELLAHVPEAIDGDRLGRGDYWSGLGENPSSIDAEAGFSVLRMLNGQFSSKLSLGID